MQSEAVIEKKVQRALKISRINGLSVAGFAGLCAVVVLLFGDFFGFAVGIAVALSGLIELKGNRLLASRIDRAFYWLVGSQIYLMIVLWGYASFNIANFDKSDPWAQFPLSFKDLLLSINPDVYLVEAMLAVTFYATYVALIIAVLIYQGGLGLYYFSRKKFLYAD